MRDGAGKEEWFAGTPPLEAMRFLMSVAATKRGRRGERYGLMANDVRRAYFYAAASETTYIELIEEDTTVEDLELDRIGVLNLAMYGTRSAAAAWHDTVVEFMKSIGFQRGRTNPCIFYNNEQDLRTIVHGDDFFSIWSSRSVDMV